MKPILAALGFALVLSAAGTAMAMDRTVTLAVKNMYCSACPYIVKKSLAAVPGVESVEVSYAKKTATVTYDDQKAKLAALTAATRKAGYPSQAVTDPATQ